MVCVIPQFCSVVEGVHSISQPNGELYEYNTLTITSLIRTLNALDCFSVGGGEGDDS